MRQVFVRISNHHVTKKASCADPFRPCCPFQTLNTGIMNGKRGCSGGPPPKMRII
jgi:hypothetical protein